MSDAKDLQAGIVPDILAILPLRGSVLMPHAVLPLGAGRASSVRLIEEAVQSGRLVGAVMQRDPKDDAPDQDGLFPVGTVTIIHKAMKQGDGSMRLVVQGLGRSASWRSSRRSRTCAPAWRPWWRPSPARTWSWRRWCAASAHSSRRSSPCRRACPTS